jgi:hypothetical protein
MIGYRNPFPIPQVSRAAKQQGTPMRTRIVLLAAASLLFCLPAQASQAAAEKEILGRVNELLMHYAANNQDAVVAMLDNPITILGSDFHTSARSPIELRELMRRDFGQWVKASFTDVREVDIRTSDTLATATFIFTFTTSQSGSTPVRLCTTWHKVNGKWLLTQSASAVAQS